MTKKYSKDMTSAEFWEHVRNLIIIVVVILTSVIVLSKLMEYINGT